MKQCKYKYKRTHIQVSCKLFSLFCDKNLKNSIIFFYFVKSKFKHTIVYNYTPQKLGAITGISEKTIRKYVDNLKKHGLVNIESGHLLFRSLKKICDDLDINDKFYDMDTRPWLTWKQFKDKFNYLLIKINSFKQGFESKLKILTGSVSKNNFSDSTLKRYKRIAKKLKEGQLFFSTRQIARTINSSHTYVSNLLKRLQKKGFLIYKEKIKKLRPCKFIPTKYNDSYYLFIKDNYLYIHYGLSIHFVK